MAQRDAIEAELLGREPDYTLFIVITSSHRSIHDVLCKVFLPETFNGQPFLLLEPTKEQKPQLFHLFEFSIEGRIGSLETEISAKTAYARAGKGRQWGSDIAEYVMIAEPQDLEIRRFLNGERKGLDVPVCGSFALTPSILLGPDFINKYHFDGNVQREVVRELSFTLAAGPKLTFANQFTYSERPEGTLAIRELAARFSEPLSISSLEDVISDLDDLLLLTSFAERHRCVCVGWSLVNDKILIQRYRRNIVIPVKSKVFLNSTLVDLYCSNEFLVAAYRRFKELEPKGPIRHGLYGTLPLHDRTMESSVLSMFLALESLTLFFRRQNDLEFILPEGEWEEFERELRAWIKAQQHLRDKPVDRSLVYGKIKELNRPPFTAVFERFVEKYQIDISDLWPVTGKGSLLELRNRIVHGEVFSQLQAWALSSATQHLQWLLERIVLTILGWPIEQSRVSAQALKFMCAYVDWKEDRKAFL